MALVSSNVNLEPYDGSRSQKSYNNVRRMLSMAYFHCKKIRRHKLQCKFLKKAAAKSVILGRKNQKKVPLNPGGTAFMYLLFL